MKHIVMYVICILTMLACNNTSRKLDTAPNPEVDLSNMEITIYQTAENTNDRLTKKGTYSFNKATQPTESEKSIFVNRDKSFQTVLGFGGAITDASAEVFAKLPQTKQNELIEAYYGNEGIHYNIIRTSIHSCDFSSGSFTYIEEGDKDLETFSIKHDKAFRLPMIKKAQDKIGDSFVFYASPWSPPAFMKSNNNMLHGGKLLPEYYQSWANYYVKFIEAYENEGIPVWGLTIQNEPMAVQRWESCIYTAEEECNFLKNYLGPTLEKSGMADKNVIVWDHNRDLISHRANTIFDDAEAAKYTWGIGFHWYETWAKGDPMWDNLRNIKESYPEMNMMFTEGCQEGYEREHLQRWSNGERYGKSMINDFNCGVVGWTDWNILLDENGGPNHVQNLCFSPIHADLATGDLIYTPSYYYIGHFSKFIESGAQRISTTSSHSSLLATSFMNADGSMSTIVMNDSDQEINYNLIVEKDELQITIPPHAIQTHVIQ